MLTLDLPDFENQHSIVAVYPLSAGSTTRECVSTLREFFRQLSLRDEVTSER